GNGSRVRMFGSSLPLSSFQKDDRSLRVTYRLQMTEGETRHISFAIVFSPEGTGSAGRGYSLALDTDASAATTVAEYRRILSRALVMSPDRTINRGLQWAKVNTVRVQHRYRIGEAFTNDPPQDIVVIRDLAWYVLGSDYLTPLFSRNLLELAERFGF